jgi:predicted RNA-binding protein with TRAM domain
MRSGFGGGGNFEQKDAPVSVGEETDVTIEAVGAKGDGIAKKEGFVIFVPNTRKGDTVRIRITKVLANMAFAEVAGEAPAKQESSERPERRAEPEDEPVDTEDFGEEQ